jgi:hypothetical protein
MRDHKTALKILEKVDCKLFFDNCVDTKLYYNNYSKCYITKKHRVTIKHILGTFPAFREHLTFKHGIGKVLDWVGVGFNLFKYNNYIGNTCVPEDSVIIASGRVLIVLSSSTDKVLKLESHIYAARYVQTIKFATKKFMDAGMENAIPRLYGSGEINNTDVFFTLMEFSKNKPLFLRSRSGKIWPNYFKAWVIPVLQQFHERNGIVLMSGSEWSKVLCAKFEEKQLPSAMQKAFNSCTQRLNNADKIIMPMGMIHGDLQPQNVHFSNGCCTLMDWSNTKNSALITDVVCDVFYKAMREPDLESSLEYWHFINGEISLNDCSSSLVGLSQVWFGWMNQWHELMYDESDLRMQLEAACWDWLGTMIHPWKSNNELWPHIRFPDCYLKNS